MLDGRSLPAPTCPACEAPLPPDDGRSADGDRRSSGDDGELRCVDCGATVPLEDGVLRFPLPDGAPSDGPEPFDALAPIYESPLWFRPLYRFVGGPTAPADDRAAIADLLDVEDATVLDVACGTGRFTRHVAADAAGVWGIDLSAGMLRRARRAVEREGLRNVRFARASAERLHFPDGAFDRVACCWALHLFDDPSAALAAARRVLADDGRIAGATLADEYVLRLPGVKLGARRTLGARTFDAAALRTLLREAGFDAVALDRRGAALFFAADA